VWRVIPALLFVALSFAASAEASRDLQSPGFRWVIVKSGRTDGATWTLLAIDSDDGRYCVKVDVMGSLRAKNCGRFYEPNGMKLGWTSDNVGRQPTFVVGAVAGAARDITIRLSNGTIRTVAGIPPGSPGLASGISFFIETKPCAAYPTAITARDIAHRIVASWSRPPKDPPLNRC
jgi:hypothetical protein